MSRGLILYNVVIILLLPVLIPWILYQLIFVPKRRSGFANRLGDVPSVKSGGVWIHAVSVGEVRAVLPMLKLLEENPDTRGKIYLSTVTPTGQETARRECPFAAEIFYFPLDLPFVPGRALDHLKPTIFITAETEIWPNFYAACRKRSIPILIVNGRISDRSMGRYRMFSWLLPDILRNVSLFLMQSDDDAKRILELGADGEKVSVTGNTKYDRQPEVNELSEQVISWASGHFFFVAGSTHEGEEEILLDALLDVRIDGVRFAFVPRHPERFNEVAELLSERGIPYIRYSEMVEGFSGNERVLLVDAMGVLESFYSISDAAFVGGSLVPVGGHNLLEPAMLGKPVISGPNLNNFREIAETLTGNGACIIVENSGDLVDTILRFVNDITEKERVGNLARIASSHSSGASERNVRMILEQLGEVH